MRNSSFHTTIQKFLDLLFPPSDRERRLRRLLITDLETLGTNRQPEKSSVKAVCDYRNEIIREVVYALKFAGSQTAADLIGERMREEILSICQEERIFDDRIIITPIPLSGKRRRERGFNQSARICKRIADVEEENVFVYKQLLEKTRTTADQTELSRSRRRKNVRGVFQAEVDIDDEAVIFVIDDVTTTGATLTEARRALRENSNAKIIGIAFAH
ncbi:MAG: hypothetical protein WD335_00915 [Candidatus Paceibacterota bacterium]